MIRRALRYMYPAEDRAVLIAASVSMSLASLLAAHVPMPAAASSPPGPSSVAPQEDEPGWDCLKHGNRMCGTADPDRVLCGSPNVVVTHSECEAYLLEDAQQTPELPKTL